MSGWVVAGKKGEWHLRGLKLPCRPLTDEQGNLRTWPTKAAAERARRDMERGMTGIDRDRGDIFRMVDRQRRRR